MERSVEILRGLPLFARLGDEALRAVADRTVVRTLPQGRILFRRGTPAEGLYVVLEGAVRVSRSNRQGREQTPHVQGPGQPPEYAEREGPVKDGTELVLPRTQGEPAAELATTRESVARAPGRMRREGAIEQRGPRVRIRSVAALESLAREG